MLNTSTGGSISTDTLIVGALWNLGRFRSSKCRPLLSRGYSAAFCVLVNGLSRGDGSAFDGVRFLSRHGADLELWAVFERSYDEVRSRHLTDVSVDTIDPADDEVIRAPRLHSLSVG